jgi:hypothetical protein
LILASLVVFDPAFQASWNAARRQYDVRMPTKDPEWVVIMEYENLPGCQHPGDAVFA